MWYSILISRRTCTWIFVIIFLFRPPGPASAGRGGLYILLLCFILFATGTYIWESARQPPANPTKRNSPLAMLIKYLQTFDTSCPLFYRGAKCPKFWPKFRPQSSSNRHIFVLQRFIGKQKQTCQGPMIGLPSYRSWSGWVPPTPRTVGAFGTPKGKSGKFLIYPPFQSIAPPMLYHLLGRGCCKKTTVPYLPIRPLEFTGGHPKG